MNHEMIPHLTIHSAHTTPSSHSITTTHKIVTSENLPPSCRPPKERDSSWRLNSPNGFPREFNILSSIYNMIEGLGIKHPMLPKLPMHRIRVNCSRDPRMNKVEESKNLINLPILEIPNESNVPSFGPIDT